MRKSEHEHYMLDVKQEIIEKAGGFYATHRDALPGPLINEDLPTL
jgi:hypothetical protein